MQITQELCKRPGLNRAGFEMPTIYIPTLLDKVRVLLIVFLKKGYVQNDAYGMCVMPLPVPQSLYLAGWYFI